MAYALKQVTIKTNNTEEGMRKIYGVWQDVLNGKLPIVFDSERTFQQGVSLVSEYSNYESDENGSYDLSIMGVTADFFQMIEAKVSKGLYIKYDETDENGDIVICTQNAWQKVWNDQKSGVIKRAYTEDYESSVPTEHSKDGKAHCYLYIALQTKNDD